MKISKLKRSVLYLSLIGFILLSVLLYTQKSKCIDLVNSERAINLEKLQQAELAVKKEMLFQAKSFDPKKWVLTFYNKEKREGGEVFTDKPMLVFRILPNSCLTCIEKELENLEKLVARHIDLKDRVLVITSFSNHSKFKVFYNNYKPKDVRMYNQSNVGNEWASGAAVYFVWKQGQVRNIYIPRLGNEVLNEEYFTHITPLVFTEKNLMLFIIDGQKLLKPKSHINEIAAETIETISSLDSIYGGKRYGEKGKYGVYIINLKK